MRSKTILIAAFFIGLTFLLGCKGNNNPTPSEQVKLAAQVDDWKLTRNDLDKLIDALPDQQRSKYSTPAGRAELAGMIMEEELYHREGLKEGLDKDPEVKKTIKDAVRRIIINEYYKRYVSEKAKPTDEEMHDYYEQHKDRFTTLPILKAQHIFSKDKKKLVDLKKRIEAGEKMTTLAYKYSEDELTSKDGGDLGYFNPGGYVRFIGYSKKWSDAVFKLDPGVVSDPIEFEKGYSLVRVNRKRPAELKPYDQVKDKIESILMKQRIDSVRTAVVDELKKRHQVRNYLEEELKLTERTPEELWNLAQTSSDSYQRLKAYKEIVNKYSKSKYAPQALFMIGFVYAEELKDQFNADRTLRKVIRNYPGTDIAKSAKWMLDNLGKPIPDFEDLDDLHKKISEQEGKKNEKNAK